MNSEPVVSVIIPTYNRKDKLIRLLDSIFKGHYTKDKLEIIVVDDASTDGTAEVVKSQFPEVKILINSKNQSFSFCRDRGARYAKGRYLFFVDDDNVLLQDTIVGLVNFLEKYEKVAVAMPIAFYYCNPNKICHPLLGNPVLPAIMRRKLVEIPSKPINVHYFHNAFMFRKDVYMMLGGFDFRLFPENEQTLYIKLKKKGYYCALVPSARVLHDVPLLGEKVKQIDEERMFYYIRDRLVLSSYEGITFYITYILFIFWMLLLYYLFQVLKNHRPDLISVIFRAAKEGLNRFHLHQTYI